MIGKIISHYKIVEEIGRGGMGIVYKAEDIKLKRTVALKFLPPELTRDAEAKARFIREAQAAAALEHNNICNIYEISDTDDGQMFIVMACYEGETLRKKIKEKRLKTEEAIDIANQIAEGLARAHEEGIVHRDIKPANIIITDRGEVKILDFGLVKLAGQAQLTKDSSTLGTVAYMSPEQLQGKEIDQRTDIWSLGVVLYEMLTGQPPFKGEYEQAVMYAILNEEPKRLENIPPELQEIVKKSLVKNPDERYTNAEDFLQGLNNVNENYGINKHVQQSIKSTKKKATIISSVIIFILIAFIASILFFPTSKPEESIKSLAVLPFINLGNDADTDYLGFSLANQIIGDLTYLKNITVRPSTSIEKYKDQSVDPIEAANELRVEFLVTGRYLKEANKIRSDIELINVATNDLIWREPIEVNFENAFQFQDIVSEKVINGLKIQFSQDERERMQTNIPKDPLAYEYYLRSISYPLTYKGDSLAVVKLRESIQLDSSYAPAFVELGYRYIRLAQNILNVTDERIRAERYYLRGLELNSELLSGLNNLAALYTDVGRPEEAIELVKKALSINPNSAWTHFRLSYIYRYTGLLDESEQEVEKALELDPGNPRCRSVGNTYKYLGKYEEARRAFDLNRGTAYQYENTGAVFLRENERIKAKEQFNRVLEMEPEGITGLSARAMKAYIEGNIEEGLQAARRLELANPYDAEVLYELASTYALLSDTNSSVRVLRKAVEGGFFCYPFFLIDPFLDSVRDDPEFQEVLALAKTKHEDFKQKYFPE